MPLPLLDLVKFAEDSWTKGSFPLASYCHRHARRDYQPDQWRLLPLNLKNAARKRVEDYEMALQLAEQAFDAFYYFQDRERAKELILQAKQLADLQKLPKFESEIVHWDGKFKELGEARTGEHWDRVKECAEAILREFPSNEEAQNSLYLAEDAERLDKSLEDVTRLEADLTASLEEDLRVLRGEVVETEIFIKAVLALVDYVRGVMPQSEGIRRLPDDAARKEIKRLIAKVVLARKELEKAIRREEDNNSTRSPIVPPRKGFIGVVSDLLTRIRKAKEEVEAGRMRLSNEALASVNYATHIRRRCDHLGEHFKASVETIMSGVCDEVEAYVSAMDLEKARNLIRAAKAHFTHAEEEYPALSGGRRHDLEHRVEQLANLMIAVVEGEPFSPRLSEADATGARHAFKLLEVFVDKMDSAVKAVTKRVTNLSKRKLWETAIEVCVSEIRIVAKDVGLWMELIRLVGNYLEVLRLRSQVADVLNLGLFRGRKYYAELLGNLESDRAMFLFEDEERNEWVRLVRKRIYRILYLCVTCGFLAGSALATLYLFFWPI